MDIEVFVDEINSGERKDEKETETPKKGTKGSISLDLIAKEIKAETKKSKRTLGELFDYFNTEEKGYFLFTEWDKLLKFIGIKINKQEVERYFAFIDKNDDGKITKKEFISTFEALIKDSVKEGSSKHLKKFIKAANDYAKKNDLTIEELFENFNRKVKGIMDYNEFDKLILTLKLELSYDDSQDLWKEISSDDELTKVEFKKYLFHDFIRF